jgi:hypothetical protein
MNIVINESLVKRNARIAQITMIAGLAVLGAGMVISFRFPDQYFVWSVGALLVGFILSQVGIYFSNRWGRRPRSDELLNQALKGLDGKYTLFHYTTPASHLLVGPSGIWVLSPRSQRGTITFSNGRWRQKGGNLYLKIFAQEGLGRPDLEIIAEIDAVKEFLKKNSPEEEKLPDVQGALIFTNDRVKIEMEPDANPLAATLPLSKLKDYVRKTAKTKPISIDKVIEIQGLLTQE